MRTDGRTDVTNPVVAFRNFANVRAQVAPKCTLEPKYPALCPVVHHIKREGVTEGWSKLRVEELRD